LPFFRPLSDLCPTQTRLVTAVSGFPKDKASSATISNNNENNDRANNSVNSARYSIDNIIKGQIGDDAYFVARHVDDWPTGRASSEEPEETELQVNVHTGPI